jgi:hypothetical protein
MGGEGRGRRGNFTSYEIIKIAIFRIASVLDTKVEIVWKIEEILFHSLPG